MPELRPFAAIRYDHTRTDGDLSKLIAPPYDVLDQPSKDALLSGSEHNVVAIDLPHLPPKSAGPAKLYEEAAARMKGWLDEGTLIREAHPALYLYHQRFEYAGRSYARRMFMARLRLVPFSDGSILPHEQTFGGPKEDRLALMKATACQLSPLLGMYGDPEDRVGSLLSASCAGDPDATGTCAGVENRMWIVSDAGVIDAVTSAMAERKVYIADGHHRYGTALMYRDFLAEENGGALPDDHPGNYVMFALASMEDPGCLILPYNRVLANVDLEAVLEAWMDGVEVVPLDEADLVLCDGRTGQRRGVRFMRRDVLTTLESDQCPAWHKLDYAYLHRYLIDELLRGRPGLEVRYVKSREAALRTAHDQDGVALLTNATPMDQLRAVSEAGGLMPAKSTYFHPKVATGLAINPLS